MYGQHLTASEIIEKVRLNGKDRRSLLATLASHGISESDIVLDAGDSWRIRTTVKQAQSLFNTRFYQFNHRRTGATVIRQWGACSLPATIKPLVELVLDIHTFPTTEQRYQRTQELAYRRAMENVKRTMLKLDADTVPVYVPQSMGALYGLPTNIPAGSNKSVSAGVVEFVEQTFDPKDLDTFSKQTAIPIIQPDPSHIFGNNSEAPEGTEAALDIQWIEGINPAMEPWFWLESDPNVWLYTFTVDFLNATMYPMILSVSYGLPEVMQCAYFDPSDCNGAPYDQYIRLVDMQFRKIGLLGVSLIVCSQDRGVDAMERRMIKSPQLQVFAPEYPGTSVYATAVGATETHNSVYKLDNPPPVCSAHSQDDWMCVSGGDEAAVSYDVAGYLSGGGFSNVSAQPAYQAKAVQAYFNSGVKLPAAGYYNATGRGYPDIAAIGTNGYIVQGGDTLVGGTSMSTPIIAATFALLQAEYMTLTGGKTLGFLNPLLYQAYADMPSVFHDITVGDNCRTAGCKSPDGVDGFLTAKGWDPVTGLGSPVYPNWVTYIQKMVAEQKKTAAKTAESIKPVKPYYKRHNHHF
jgi:tripeptidyl-peptidase-1